MQIKRQIPITPSPKKAIASKKLKEYVSPGKPLTIKVSTPLRAVNNEASGILLHSSLHTSPIFQTPKSTTKNNNGRLDKAKLMSPSVGISPRANLPSIQSSVVLNNSPLVQISRSNSKGKIPQIPKLSIEQMNSSFEEWMKIAADNVSSF